MLKQKPKLIIIAGPTAVGKTDLCVQLAQIFKTEIVSCDSRQFYQELSIGTAKPTSDEMQGIKHHFIDSHSIRDYYSVGDYERDAMNLLAELFEYHACVIMTGGSGLFVKAIVEGLDVMPEVDLEIREKLMQRLENEGIESLSCELETLDPIYASQIELKNSQRVVRALEICISTGKPFSEFLKKTKAERPFDIIKIGLERPREELYARINQRVDLMLSKGLLDEAKAVENFRKHNALQTVGYKEVFDYFDNTLEYETMCELIKRNTRRYAKRQMTWFKNQDTFQWFEMNSNTIDEVKEYIQKNMDECK